MKKALIALALLFPLPVNAALSHFWVNNGGWKVPQEDLLPKVTCTTCTYGVNWNGDTYTVTAAKGEYVGFYLSMGNNTTADIEDVSVSISSFTGSNGGAIISTATLITGVTNYANPIEVFYVRYLPIAGMTQLSWDGSEVDQRDLPERFRRPCTQGANACVANEGTLWTDRPDRDKHIPEILVPYEAVFDSSFTVTASSSQAIWFDVWIASTLPAGVYTSTITVREGVAVSTRIPVHITVRDFKLPDSPSQKAITYITPFNINYRHQGEHFPDEPGDNPYLATRQNYAKMLHRHKFAAIIGDNCCNACTSTQPCPEFQARLNGSLYSPTSGYITGPGIGIGDSIFSIGTYGNWDSASWSTFTVTGAGGFCTNVEAWSDYMEANFANVQSFIYLADELPDLTPLETWATWMSTACNVGNYPISSMATGSFVDAAADAPHLNIPVATTFIRASSQTWQDTADDYQLGGTTQAWIYNGHEPGSGSMYATENDGISPLVNFWMMFKKDVPVWFGWSADYWTDSNNQGQPPDNTEDNDIFNEAKTFGYDQWETSMSSSPTKGRTGFGYSNGDGVLLYPGHDESPYATDDYGFDGPIASWRLKMLRRGIQDGDYLHLANAEDPSATADIVHAIVPKALWDNNCFDSGDCTYILGGRTWTNEPDAWEQARLELADLIPEDAGEEQPTQTRFRGVMILRGGISVR